jgi:FKBP-type peptidyl-prolyl cis-trans isomerase FkpA
MKRHILLVAWLSANVSCNRDVTGLEPPSDPTKETFAPSLGVNLSQMTRLPTGVYYRDLIVGTGAETSEKTDTVWITYAGYLKDGKLFDSGTNQKFEPNSLITGLRGGMVQMKVGGKRKLVIPSAQGYGGTSRRGPDGKILIPRQSTLVFDVELLKLHTPAPTPAPSP